MTQVLKKDIFTEMLKEDTGKALCDSGGIYGRNYELNSGRDFEKESEGRLLINGYIEASISTYHYMKEHLELSEWLQAEFETFCDRDDQKDESWLGTMQNFAEHLSESHEVTGLYGDGDPMLVNTYNHESLLDQVLQYLYMEIDGDAYVLLQVHGGCDVRGGYTRPRAFEVTDYDSAGFFSDRDATITCDNDRDHYWQTDDGYHWYAEGACGSGAGTQLEAYEQVEIEDNPEDDCLPAAVANTLTGDPKLYHTSEGQGFCPICGGHLSIGMY